ncbi:tRNA (adenosine(37)-N6)-threonylcarbamoyltransferase complex dimerization subunit type 1 TsaB [Candidatus Melainabacteria bacterium MEL.A1]|jgi:universal bacterial protein yeaZ|nr:tRNA (adenosine(37)-N6)-threonylcarbamoyltransferase complex dimerization subunit type 1 TsaB [Candidatus Melainabacteria bacterium MEL.A1]DAA86341.1 MAG TPA: tRNA (adenosine(37)-N6)-threonylcarbamoyltransferase complex dimerization subunit type 1 TsaB [Candidatus Gastranaerophilales bacterium HUM_2]
MITLAFDTCLDKMYAVLKKDGEILASKVVENTGNKYHSAFLISTLQEIMSLNDVKPQDVNLIAVNIGPGSFTGIRACVTVARVMAQQLDCKAVGVSSLEILSRLADKNPLVALDARKDSAYLYYDGEIRGAIRLEEVQEIIKKGEYSVITDDKLQPILGGTSYQQITCQLGEILADIAENKNAEGNWRKLKPLYIQPPPGV